MPNAVAADVRTAAAAVLVQDGTLEVRCPVGTAETVTPAPDPGRGADVSADA
ncbi:hypothetical protein [Streptomyces zaehneri]|uniref:hypothetical protein n=1 Tax=Streptomyces zaehneri TaxID=3051180 RepID=UPI0028D462A2|nr:hypothetical protein [Streptomyces sp. DSM 40713]